MAADTGDATAAFIVADFLTLSFVYLLRDDTCPHLFDVLFALAALLGAVGYVFGLLDGRVPYDKPVQAFTTFSVSLAFFFLFYRDAVPRQRRIRTNAMRDALLDLVRLRRGLAPTVNNA